MFILINLNSLNNSVTYTLFNLAVICNKLVSNSITLRPVHIEETSLIGDEIYFKARPPPLINAIARIILNQIN